MNNDIYIHFYKTGQEQNISVLYKSSDNLHSWELLSSQSTLECISSSFLPARGSTLTTYQSQLLLLGGTYISRKFFGFGTNSKIWSYDFAQGSFTQSSYPPVIIQYEYTSAINPKDPECLILATGHHRHSLSVVEVLIENQWYISLPLPKPSISCLTVHEGELFSASDTTLYHCSLQSMIDCCVQQDVISNNIWKKIVTNAPLSSLISFGQRLLGYGVPPFGYGKQLCIYDPKFHLWLPMNGVFVKSISDGSTTVRPQVVVGIPEELLQFTVVDHSVRVHRAVLTGKCIVLLDYTKHVYAVLHLC